MVCGKLLSTVTMNTSSAAALSSTWHSWKRLVVTCDSSLSSRPPLTAWKITFAPICASRWDRCVSTVGVQPGLAHMSLQISPPTVMPLKSNTRSGLVAKWLISPTVGSVMVPHSSVLVWQPRYVPSGR